MNEGCSLGDVAGTDPLMLANRSAVTEPFTDLSFDGLRRLSVSRTYSSADFTVRGGGAPGIFGRGWHHDWEGQVHCIGNGGVCQVEAGLGVWLDFHRTQTVTGTSAYAGETLEVFVRAEVEALGAGGQDLLLRRTATGEFILHQSDGRELHFVPTANAPSCSNPDGDFCFDLARNGRARLTTEVDRNGRFVQLAYNVPGALMTLTDGLGNTLALKSSATCPTRATMAAVNGVDYISYEYHPGCDTLKRAYVLVDGNPGHDLRAYEYQATPGPGYLTSVRNAGGDAIAEFGYATNGDAISLVDRDSTIAVDYPDPTHDRVVRSYSSASSSTSTTRGGGGKAGVVQNKANFWYMSWLGRMLRCHEDEQHHVRYFERDSHHRVTRIAEYAPGAYSCQDSKPPAASLVPLREEWLEYGVQRTVAVATQFNPNMPTRIIRRSLHAGKAGAATDPFRSETFDYYRERRTGDPVGYSCGGAGLPDGAVVCRRSVRGYTLDSMANAVAEEHTSYFTYDSRGRLTGALGPVFTAGSAPLVNVDPEEVRTYYPDDDADKNRRGRVRTITRRATGSSTLTVTYQTWGVFGPQSILDYNNRTTTLTWDQQGRIEGVLTPDGHQVSVRYYDGQWPRLILLGSGAVRRFGYDDKGRVKTVEALSGDPDVPGATPTVGWTETRDHDPAGNAKLVARRDDSGSVVWKRERTHDDEHRPATEVHPVLAGVSASWEFDASGFLTSFTDEEGRVTGFTPDDLNRPFAVKRTGKQPDGVTPVSMDVATYAYEPWAALVGSVTDGAGRKTSYTHDDFGNVLTVKPDTTTTSIGFTYGYDARGNVVSRSGGDSQLTYTYDGLDRLTSLRAKQLTANTTVTYTYVYDAAGQLGRLYSIAEPDRTTTFGYDTVGRLTSEVLLESGVNGPLTTTYAYDGDGDLQEVHSPAGLNVKYERDPVTKAITEVRNVSNNPTSGTKFARLIKHLPAGPITNLTFPSGAALTQGFNARYEPMAMISGPFSASYAMSPAGDVSAIGAATFRHDFLDRLTEMNPGHGAGATSYSYKYSGDRVTEAWTIAAPPKKAFTFAYDLNSNLSAVTTWSSAGVATGTTCLVHDALNRLTAVGPALAIPAVGAAACKTEADLISVATRFKYDARNRRVARQDGAGAWKQWALLPDGSPLTEFTKPTTSFGPWVKVREYVWLEGRPLAQVEYPGPTADEGFVYSVHVDHIGLPRAMTSATNAVVWTATPTRPYGDVAETSATDPANGRTVVTNLRLPGQYDERLLASVGLQGPYYNWNRWYLPTLGRYMELDPIAMRGGFNGPWAPNWYGYAEGNPLRFVDPWGLTVTCTYSQSTGLLVCTNDTNGQQVISQTGYAGNGPGLNNPALQCVSFVGPLPQGAYTMGTSTNSPNTGPVTIPLTPSPTTNMCGRDLMRIHGDNPQQNNTASSGCIVMPVWVRSTINSNGGGSLTVTP